MTQLPEGRKGFYEGEKGQRGHNRPQAGLGVREQKLRVSRGETVKERCGW